MENVLDKVDAATVTYDVAIAVNGTPVFTQAAVEHFYLTRWRKTFPVGGTTFASIRPNVAAFTGANAVPPYLASVVTNVVSTPDAANFGILQSGALDPIMSDHGGRAELAPLPDWTARYLVHTDPAQRAFVLANGDLSGSWPVHMREADDSARHGVGAERLLSLDERPNLWLDERAQSAGWDYVAGTPMPMREYGTDIPAAGQSPLLPDNAHQPSIAFVPYLLTGDRYYAEEMAFWANYGMLRTYPGDGVRTSRGILENGEVRAFGWALRNLADAAAYYPDASAVKGYLSGKVVNNLQWLDAHARAQDPIANPFQILWVNMRPDGPQYIALWEQAYLAYAIDRANRHGFVGGLAERDAIARFHLKLFTSDPDYPRAEAGAYVIAVGTPSDSNPALFGTYFTTMAQIWAGTQGQERPFAGFYGTEARLDLMYGVQNGWPGAQAAYDYLWPFIGTAPTPCVTLGGAVLPDLTCRAGWAVDFPSNAAAPAAAQVTSPSAGSTLSGGTQVFTWVAAAGASAYQLTVGTAQGANEYLSGPEVTALSASVGGLPTGGGAIWVRLSTLMNDGWRFSDSRYVAASTTGPGTAAAPTKVGSLVAGTFNDATGHSAQSHLVYAPNAGVWWLFTLSSAHDSFADSHGPQLLQQRAEPRDGATWTAGAPSPHLANAGFATNAVFAGGRSLGAAVLSIAGSDYAHVFASTAFDGQVASNGHIRARLGCECHRRGARGTTPVRPTRHHSGRGRPNSGNPPSAASTHSSWGNVIGISTGGFIHHSSVTMDQEVDCAAARSTNADIAATWTNGFGVNVVGASPPNADRGHRQVDGVRVQGGGVRAAGSPTSCSPSTATARWRSRTSRTCASSGRRRPGGGPTLPGPAAATAPSSRPTRPSMPPTGRWCR